ncbi:MAG: DUF6056 family protein [Eubacteriales bacterium]
MKQLQKLKWKIDEKLVVKIIIILFIISLIPLFLLAKYCFPQADDYSFAAGTHVAWVATGSLWEVMKAAIEKVEFCYMQWQGTYFSIFLMTLQPAVFSEKLYCIVPFLMFGAMISSIYFLYKVILMDCLEVTKEKTMMIALPIIFLIIQRMVEGTQAFYWYNGAVHYMLLQSLTFLLVGILIQIVCGKNQKQKISKVIAILILSFCMGGGNYISAIFCFVCYLGILTISFLKKQFRTLYGKAVVGGFFVFVIGFACNVLAPGNTVRQSSIGETASPVKAILISIYYFGEKMLEWNEWLLIFIFLSLIPVIWKIVMETKFDFPYPVIVISYSLGMVAAMFTPNVYTSLSVGADRILNIIYMTYVIVIFISVFYAMGWLANQMKKSASYREHPIEKSYGKSTKLYWGALCGVSIFFMTLVLMVEQDYLNTVTAIEVLISGDAKELEEQYEMNLEKLQDPNQREVEIMQFTIRPKLLTSTSISEWEEAIRLFYEKESVTFVIKEE